MDLKEQKEQARVKGRTLAAGSSMLQNSLEEVGLEQVGVRDYRFLRGNHAGTLASQSNTHYLAWYAGTVIMGRMIETQAMKGVLADVYTDFIQLGANLLTVDRMKNVGSQVASGKAVYTSSQPRVAQAGTRMVFQRLRETASVAMHHQIDDVLENMDEEQFDAQSI